jgi:hypothetical protein
MTLCGFEDFSAGGPEDKWWRICCARSIMTDENRLKEMGKNKRAWFPEMMLSTYRSWTVIHGEVKAGKVYTMVKLSLEQL